MYLAGLYFLLAIASVLIIAAALRGSQASLNLLIPAGVVFLIMSAAVFNSGVQVQTGELKTNVSSDTTEINQTYTNLFQNSNLIKQNWIGLLLTGIALVLILIGTAWRFF